MTTHENWNKIPGLTLAFQCLLKGFSLWELAGSWKLKLFLSRWDSWVQVSVFSRSYCSIFKAGHMERALTGFCGSDIYNYGPMINIAVGSPFSIRFDCKLQISDLVCAFLPAQPCRCSLDSLCSSVVPESWMVLRLTFPFWLNLADLSLSCRRSGLI